MIAEMRKNITSDRTLPGKKRQKVVRLSEPAAEKIREFVSRVRGTKMDPVGTAVVDWFFDQPQAFQAAVLGHVPEELNAQCADVLDALAKKLRTRPGSGFKDRVEHRD